jgi:hypothetical protein
MNAVDAVPLEEEEKNSCASHLVLSGDYYDDGGLHLLLVTEDIGQSRQVDSYKLAQGQRPILSIEMKRISTQHSLCIVYPCGYKRYQHSRLL